MQRIADRDVLAGAWNAILDNDSQDGALAVGVERFARDADDRLGVIADSLTVGTFTAGPLTPVPLTRPDGAVRLLHVPTVADRVVERALLAVLTPIVDPWLGAASFAYRPGLGVADAVQAVARLRDEGLRWVCRCDIDNCFPTIPKDLLRRKIRALLADDPAVVDLLMVLLARRVAGRSSGALPGLPQGSPLSPTWANLVLADFDSVVTRAGFPLIRYSDDMVIAAADRDEAWEAMRVASDAAAAVGMSLGADKSAVMSFDDGFVFLGEDFGPRYPPALDDHRVADPPRRVLYLGVQGSRARIDDGRVVVESGDDSELLNVPSGLVERVVAFGGVGISAGLRSWALANQVDLVFLSRRGSYLGHAWAAAGDHRVSRLRAQLAAADDPAVRLPFGRAVVAAKIRKQIVLLQRMSRRDNAEPISDVARQMDALLGMVPDCGSRDELMGMEGAAARQYFQAMGRVVPKDLRFEGRSRRPPADVVNAALSYGYAILLGEAVSALCAAGLDPAIGLLHADDDQRPSLALDLMEEFRPLVVDQVVITAARRGGLTASHARREESVPGVLLTKAGKERVVDGYELRMLQRTTGALPGVTGTLRRHLYRQAEQVAALVHRRTDRWVGLSWR